MCAGARGLQPSTNAAKSGQRLYFFPLSATVNVPKSP
jgi:hypothetical protein